MSSKRKIQVFSAGCAACVEAIELVRDLACPSCDVEVLDMRQPGVAENAEALGIHRVPAVVIDGELAECCRNGGQIDVEVLQSMGLGRA